jgi:hypothetical protein
VIKGRRMIWAVHVSHIGDKRGAYRVLVRRPDGKRPLGRPRLEGRIILKWISKWFGEAWTGLIWLVVNLRVP